MGLFPELAEVDPRSLDRELRRSLRGLAADRADEVARLLTLTLEALPEDPERALRYAQQARARASRLSSIREVSAVAAYRAGDFAVALSDFRAYRRMSGETIHLPEEADCERGLQRPRRALELARSEVANALGPVEHAELLIVAAGARRDMDQPEAAVVSLQAAVARAEGKPWAARIYYAFADALLAADRSEEALTYFQRAGVAQGALETDAEERVLELQGISIRVDEATVDQMSTTQAAGAGVPTTSNEPAEVADPTEVAGPTDGQDPGRSRSRSAGRPPRPEPGAADTGEVRDQGKRQRRGGR